MSCLLIREGRWTGAELWWEGSKIYIIRPVVIKKKWVKGLAEQMKLFCLYFCWVGSQLCSDTGEEKSRSPGLGGGVYLWRDRVLGLCF